MKTTRLAPGIYNVQIGAKTYHVERFPDGAWLTFEPARGFREYLNDFATKRAALRSLQLQA